MNQSDLKRTSDTSGLWADRLIAAVPLATVLAVGILLAHHTLTDLDIWLHLRAGRDLLAGAGFSRLNTYSFTEPDFPWLNHEWLFQVIAAWTGPVRDQALETLRGWHLLRIGLIGTIVSILVLGDGNLNRLKNLPRSPRIFWTSIAAMAGLLLIWPRFNLRPELASYVFFILLVRRIDSHYSSPAPTTPWRDRSLWIIGLLTVAWSQFHGFAALAPALVLLRIGLYYLRGFTGRTEEAGAALSARAIWLPLVLAVVALLLTPNLWHGLLFPLRALGQLGSETTRLEQTISELVPLLQTRNSLGLTLTVFKVSLVWSVVFVILGWGRASTFRILICLAAAAAAVNNQRNVALYGLSFALLHSGYGGVWPRAAWSRRLKWTQKIRVSRRSGNVLLAAIVVGAGIWWAGAILSNSFYLREGVGRRYGTGATPATYPQAASERLSAQAAARTFANLDAAAYLLANSEARLFIDGRTEAYPARRWLQYSRLKRGDQEALALLESEHVSAIVLNLSSGSFTKLAATLLASSRWLVGAADGGGLLFLRHAEGPVPPGTEIIRTAADGLRQRKGQDATRTADSCQAAADLYLLAGDRSGATAALLQGLAARPDHPNLNHNLGNILMSNDRFAEAASHFAKALTVNGRLAGSALNLGVCQLRLGRVQESVRSFRRSLAINSDSVAAWANLAAALRRSGNRAKAIEALEHAVALTPNDARLRRQLSEWQRTTR